MAAVRSGGPSLAAEDLVDAALERLGAEELRGLIRDLLPELAALERGLLAVRVVERAARTGGFSPAALPEAEVRAVEAFAAAALQRGFAEPQEVDHALHQATHACLARDYRSASRLFGALLPPLAAAAIDVGQSELLQDALSVDLGDCVARFLVSLWFTAAPAERAPEVLAALREVGSLACVSEPIREMERVAVEPLPQLDSFLSAWRALLGDAPPPGPEHPWDSDEDRWRREVTLRLDGPDGLARLARTTRRDADLRAWCGSLADARQWEAALAACEEAAGLAAADSTGRADLLDGAALAAQELGRADVAGRLERAWRERPTLPRLVRWLAAAGAAAGGDAPALRQSAAAALAACPDGHDRQRALLLVVLRQASAAAALLAAAPGLGWSAGEHPGRLLWPVFRALLGAVPLERAFADPELGEARLDLGDAPPSPPGHADAPRLRTPGMAELLARADVRGPLQGEPRAAVLAALRQAAAARVAGVTGGGRQRHYGHAARLVADCVALDPTPATKRWLADLRRDYARYPALRRALDERLADVPGAG